MRGLLVYRAKMLVMSVNGYNLMEQGNQEQRARYVAKLLERGSFLFEPEDTVRLAPL